MLKQNETYRASVGAGLLGDLFGKERFQYRLDSVKMNVGPVGPAKQSPPG